MPSIGDCETLVRFYNRRQYAVGGQKPRNCNSSIHQLGAHVLSGQTPRVCQMAFTVITPDGAYAAVPALAFGFSAHERDATFDGGMWGLVRLPGTGCARREQ
ncbi:hypothetical protein BTHE68_26220 [Burkholderia sp. THE68]|nr:hypothetical protein BTHE68_26220 [Burkholderia sp. THE68]